MIQEIFAAIRFLTVLPLPAPRNPPANQLVRSMAFFPAVGFLIAFVSLWIFALMMPWLPPRPAHLVLVAAPLVLSGGLHLDGFANFCDGFFGGRNRAEVLRIMKDPHIGVFGAAGVVILLLAKFELLQSLPNKGAVYLLALTAGRWAQVVLSFALPAAAEGSLAASVARKVGGRELGIATITLFAVTFIAGWPGFAAFLGALGILGGLGWLFRRKIGGITEGLLGAASEITELTALAAAGIVV